nr:MAG TPA: hypothetical protein [Caudoviricetes sp.]
MLKITIKNDGLIKSIIMNPDSLEPTSEDEDSQVEGFGIKVLKNGRAYIASFGHGEAASKAVYKKLARIDKEMDAGLLSITIDEVEDAWDGEE